MRLQLEENARDIGIALLLEFVGAYREEKTAGNAHFSVATKFGAEGAGLVTVHQLTKDHTVNQYATRTTYHLGRNINDVDEAHQTRRPYIE